MNALQPIMVFLVVMFRKFPERKREREGVEKNENQKMLICSHDKGAGSKSFCVLVRLRVQHTLRAANPRILGHALCPILKMLCGQSNCDVYWENTNCSRHSSRGRGDRGDVAQTYPHPAWEALIPIVVVGWYETEWLLSSVVLS